MRVQPLKEKTRGFQNEDLEHRTLNERGIRSWACLSHVWTLSNANVREDAYLQWDVDGGCARARSGSFIDGLLRKRHQNQQQQFAPVHAGVVG